MPWYQFQCFWGDGRQITAETQIENGANGDSSSPISSTGLNGGEGTSTMCPTYGVDPLTDPLGSGQTKLEGRTWQLGYVHDLMVDCQRKHKTTKNSHFCHRSVSANPASGCPSGGKQWHLSQFGRPAHSSCDCSYRDGIAGGCWVNDPAPAMEACKCVYDGFWTCRKCKISNVHRHLTAN